MKIFSKTLSILFSLCLLGAIGAGAYFLLRWAWGMVPQISFQEIPLTNIISFVTLLAVSIIAIRVRRISKQTSANHLSVEKGVTYQFLIELWKGKINEEPMAGEQSATAINSELEALDHMLALYGSSGVIKAHIMLRSMEQINGAKSREVKSQFAKTIIEIRKDLGSEARELVAEDLTQLLFDNSQKPDTSVRMNAYDNLKPRVSLVSNS